MEEIQKQEMAVRWQLSRLGWKSFQVCPARIGSLAIVSLSAETGRPAGFAKLVVQVCEWFAACGPDAATSRMI